MKKILLSLIVISAFLIPPDLIGGKRITMYFFESGVCPACERARKAMPALKRQFPGLVVYSYMVRNKYGKVNAIHKRNTRLLFSKLRRLQRNAGKRPVIISGYRKYRLQFKSGIPYYMKRISQYTVLKKEIPIPVFIIGDEAIIGYNRMMIMRKLRSLQ